MNLIHILVGTKGQLIKMVPIIRELQTRNVSFNFINAGFHTNIIGDLIDVFHLKKPDIIIDNKKNDVITAMDGAKWLALNFIRGTRLIKKIFQKENRNDILVVHGDAPPALLGLLIGKIANVKIAHVEAGGRSFDFLNPFPEESIRFLVDKFGDYLFAPCEEGVKNLQKMRTKGKIYNTRYNTVLDTVKLSIKSGVPVEIPQEDYVVVTIHRFETLYSLDIVRKIINIIEQISKEKKIIFVLHEPTKRKMIEYRLLERLEKNKNIDIRPILIYPAFIKLVNEAEFIVTDGGGLQSETYYLGKPCLILRKVLEFSYGINENICASGLNDKKINEFLRNYKQYSSEPLIHLDYSPSNFIVDILVNI